MFFAGYVVLVCFGFGQVREEYRSDEAVVDELGSVQAAGDHTPYEEDALEKPVEGDEKQDEIREELDERQRREHHPVGQPERVVFLVAGLDGQNRGVRGVGESDQAGDQLGAVSDDDQRTENEAGAQNKFAPLDAGPLLDFLQELVELVVLLQLLVQFQQQVIDGKHIDQGIRDGITGRRDSRGVP